ncbi:Zn-dependent hydrolase/oxidoreductase family protein [Macrophomina phaseolina]|uniref:Zn-dependent hydrolase/oxidoreductase family protein n=1 Tax=Macrophomina phaseolina TaxID=35725 RepID=A0ABQ8G2K5_9PEZI|nr:Zn-dependent hydrolase/oxidoreductase family protein [Macrophomina phaseolina]
MSCTHPTPAVRLVENSTAPADAAEKKHHLKNGKTGFVNPWPSWQPMNPEAAKAHLKNEREPGHCPAPECLLRKCQIQVLKPTFSTARYGTDGTSLRATWLGHACYLVELPCGLRVLFDPVLTDRCSPVSWFGPKRFTKLPCEVHEIPIIDIVVISHNHYDHLSHPTVVEIHKLHPHAHFFVPLGDAEWFRSSGIPNVTELDWWEEADITLEPHGAGDNKRAMTARVSCLPAQHTTGRGPLGTDKSLWASWADDQVRASVYFAGDTGYRDVTGVPAGTSDDWAAPYDAGLPVCPGFRQIGELRGPFTLGLLPIGAYEPRALMASVHSNPRDAVEIFKDTRCRRALAMHWGTWIMGDEDVREPVRLLEQALRTCGIATVGVFDACMIGETTTFAVE